MQKIGILGGGQLGRMLLQAAADFVVETYVLENDPGCPAAHLCHHFVKGDIQSFDDVYHFGKGLDALTIEIEAVNVDALEALEKEGVRVYPKPSAIRTIKNKILQKTFYKENEIPSPAFIITQNKAEAQSRTDLLPAVHKLGEGGYDGRGVEVLHKQSDLERAFDQPAVMETMVEIEKEIAITVAKNDAGQLTLFPAVEMLFDPKLNLLDFQLSPARIDKQILWKAEAMAQKVVEKLDSPGLFAVELFIDRKGNVWVNETAPRVHNSGHHTIEANYCSQYHMLLRILMQLPLGNTQPIIPSSIVNILGAPGYTGDAIYEGLEEVLKMDNVFIHLYGKKTTKPGRKMGHVTILSQEPQELIFKANKIKNTLKVIA
ncbi:5-(carboxyamino)imidazole ribonucleotide synthase [Arachidicoccus rhizosphaerae]|uniref:N5-carboxyaminoimidazole ribonucleotide synthase n=1 Tax=Arachidicoccus rhizosphaerae TaxID=551991 RepID=A0A1H3XVT1_9BACT|nr:5-(carboxyamino)imidazole ribonucleotide synthase [Arachidicoccus rhizosphaerae]SEA03486.1 5-(carboxyamino)imidazole ribonucleotide synthase [Arachidicoccus rhizosphaerae]